MKDPPRTIVAVSARQARRGWSRFAGVPDLRGPEPHRAADLNDLDLVSRCDSAAIEWNTGKSCPSRKRL